jgi:hypothetical protein
MYPLRDWVTCIDGCVKKIINNLGTTKDSFTIGGKRKRFYFLRMIC